MIEELGLAFVFLFARKRRYNAMAQQFATSHSDLFWVSGLSRAKKESKKGGSAHGDIEKSPPGRLAPHRTVHVLASMYVCESVR